MQYKHLQQLSEVNMSLLKKLKSDQETRQQKLKRPANKLVLVEGFEGAGDKSVMIGKDVTTGKAIKVSLRAEASPGDNARPTIDVMMDEGYEHKLDVGGIVMAEGCYQSNADGSEFVANWLSTYQHNSSKDASQWLMTPPSERNPKDSMRLALNGPCNVTLVESREYSNNGGPVITKPRVLVDMYTPQKAKMFKVSSIEEMESLIAESISPKSKIVESDTTAVIRYIEKETNESFVIGVPSSRTILVDGEYVKEDAAVTAAGYVDSTLKSPDSAMSALAEAFKEGDILDVEYVPASRFAVVGKSLSNLKIFDADGKIKRSAEGVKSKTQGERYQSMFRTETGGQKQVRLLETNLYAIFYGDSNKPIVGGFTTTGGYTKGYTLDRLPTENFKPTVEAKKPYNKNPTEQAKPEEAKSQGDDSKSQPAEDKSPSKQSDVSKEELASPDDISEAELAELDEAFGDLDDLEMPGLNNK
jgi:hypothetical protein